MTPFNSWVRILSVAVFSVSFVLGMALVTWYEITEVAHDTPLATIIAIIVKGQAVSVVSAGLSAVVEGGHYIVVIAYHMVQRGVEKGREEGRVEGRVEAYEDANKQNEDYYKRMQAALEAGEKFDEPPPRFSSNGR